MKKVVGLLLMLTILSSGRAEDLPPKWIAVSEEIAKVLKGAGCVCKKWNGVNFCRGEGDDEFSLAVLKEKDGLLFLCSQQSYRVPYSSVILYSTIIER